MLTILTQALTDTQRLLTGPEGRRRWKRLALYAAIAGIAGAGIQPPPLGLLQPVWADASGREQLVAAVRPYAVPLIGLLVTAVVFAAWARSFTFRFVVALTDATGEPDISRGVRHFLWSSALTVPLYALLWILEWRVAGRGWERLLSAPNAEVAGILIGLLLRFLGVLVPWAVLTLPVMVVLYELTPTAMVSGRCGVLGGFREVRRRVRGSPREFLGYFAVRLALQAVGTGAAAIVLLPCLAAAALVGLPLLLAAWVVAGQAGGWGSPVGSAAAGGALTAVAVIGYCFLCAALVPVGVLLFAFARSYVNPKPPAPVP